MELKFWYVVDGHHIFQRRQFLLKTSSWLVSALKFQPQFGQLGSAKNFIISNFCKKNLLFIVYILMNMASFDSFHSDKCGERYERS